MKGRKLANVVINVCVLAMWMLCDMASKHLFCMHTRRTQYRKLSYYKKYNSVTVRDVSKTLRSETEMRSGRLSSSPRRDQDVNRPRLSTPTPTLPSNSLPQEFPMQYKEECIHYVAYIMLMWHTCRLHDAVLYYFLAPKFNAVQSTCSGTSVFLVIKKHHLFTFLNIA